MIFTCSTFSYVSIKLIYIDLMSHQGAAGKIASSVVFKITWSTLFGSNIKLEQSENISMAPTQDDTHL